MSLSIADADAPTGTLTPQGSGEQTPPPVVCRATPTPSEFYGESEPGAGPIVQQEQDEDIPAAQSFPEQDEQTGHALAATEISMVESDEPTELRAMQQYARAALQGSPRLVKMCLVGVVREMKFELF